MTDQAQDKLIAELQEENDLLREEVRVSRRASEITARLVVEQFVRIDEILQKLEEKANTEKQLGEELGKRLREAEDSKSQLALDRERLHGMQIAAVNMMEDIAAARGVAEAATQAKSDFLANMSHEIRTPMTAILGFTDVLLEQGNLEDAPPSRIEAAQTIKRNGQYLLGIINDILDLSKVEAGKMVVDHIPCDVCRLVADVADLVRVQADGKGLSFNTEFEGAIPRTIKTDPARLRQILINLIGNAIKFTETGGVRLEISLVEYAGQNMMQFDVVDTGIGMNDDQISKLFQPFTQADSSTTRRFGGTGLGLTISKRFAEMLGGDITVDSEPGRGSIFRLAVAAGELDGVEMVDDPSEAGTVLLGEREKLSHDDKLHCRILLAEDGPDNQRLIAHVLRKAGAEVTIVDNGRAAVDEALMAIAEGNSYCILLMDMQMPIMDGYEATRKLREKGYAKPIIALTAHAMAGDRAKCEQAGCDDYATKPIVRQTLIDTIRKHLPVAEATLQA